MTAKAQTRTPAKANGAKANGQADATLAEAIAYEEGVRQEAEAIWTADENADDAEVEPFILRLLRPLLRRPIPTGFIEHLGELPGKPYESTGVKSVQVQMDRLDNVLGPHNWGYEATYSDDGKRCYVRAWVGKADDPLFTRDSWGGVKQGSTEGNIFKGSFTNAAKLALARLGPGWEVYVGAADFDPDTDEAAAKAQEGKGEEQAVRLLPADKVEALKKLVEEAGLTAYLPAKLREAGVKKVEELTVEQAISVYQWATESKGGE